MRYHQFLLHHYLMKIQNNHTLFIFIYNFYLDYFNILYFLNFDLWNAIYLIKQYFILMCYYLLTHHLNHM
jgi:hypothetical protein